MNVSMQLLKAFPKQTAQFVSKNLPTIMTSLGVVGFVATIYETSKATLKAERYLKEAEEKKEEPLTKKEKALIFAKTCWKAFLIGLITIGLFCGAHKISLKRQAALGTALAMATQDLDEYKAKVVETLGEKKADKIEDDISADKVNAYVYDAAAVKGNGPLWVLSWCNVPFRGNLEDIRRTFNDLNEDMYRGTGKAYFTQEISLNDVLEALSAACNAPQLGPVDLGEQFGFSPELTGNIDYEIRYSHTKDGEPCGYIKIKPLPLTENLKDIYY
jgi:hypothetical protein